MFSKTGIGWRAFSFSGDLAERRPNLDCKLPLGGWHHERAG
jgi:hypothetical protein